MNKFLLAIIFVFLIASGAAIFFVRDHLIQKNIYSISQDRITPNDVISNDDNISFSSNQNNQFNSSNDNQSRFSSPLDRAKERVAKKPFGIYITPDTSPVQPERFKGFHTGTDFEIFPEELNTDVPVTAVCPGKLLVKEFASGYGGVAVESCELNNSPLTVVYGHLKLTSISWKTGDNINTGDTIGILGKAHSSETNGERKHLHLGFHKGSGINIKGYVQTENELSGWIDPCQYVCPKN